MPASQIRDRNVLFLEFVRCGRSSGGTPDVARLVTVSPGGRIRAETLTISYQGQPRPAGDLQTEECTPLELVERLLATVDGHPLYGEDSHQLVFLGELFQKAERRQSVTWKPVRALWPSRLPELEVAFLSAKGAVKTELSLYANHRSLISKQAAIYSISRDIEQHIGSIDLLDVRFHKARAYADEFAGRAASSLRPFLSLVSDEGGYDQGRLAGLPPLSRTMEAADLGRNDLLLRHAYPSGEARARIL